MIHIRQTITAILLAAATCATQAQYQTITDSNGKKMEIYIPIAEEEDTKDEVIFTDDKFYQQQGNYGYFKDYAASETETDAISRQIKRLPGSMPMTYNEEVKKYIDRYVKAGRKSTSCLLARAKYYNHFFEEALRTYGLPLELKHLPVIESGLDPNATSRVGAAGLWQFMTVTGREYDLCINSYIDERCDPVKSSDAAARLLSDLYRRFGDWNLALAAYNCGSGRVQNAIERAGGNNDFWEIYQYLPKETRGYVPAFIAANYVMTYSGDYDIYPEPTGLPQKPGKVQITKDVSFAKVANLLNMEVDELKKLNPQFRQGIIKATNGNATLLLPSEQVARFNSCSPLLYEDPQPTDNTQPNMAANTNNLPQQELTQINTAY